MEWIKKESKNYIFNYHKESLAEKDIDKIVDIQETCYEFICRSLNVTMKNKIKYYLCESNIEVGNLYGDNEPCNGFAREPNEIYAVYNKKIKCIGFHEDAHIISYNTLSTPNQVFIREGFAMFFDKTYCGVSNQAWVNFFINNNLYISIGELLINDNFYKYSDMITYPIAGAFVEYIISLYGIEKFKIFYNNIKEDFEGAFFSVFNDPLTLMEEKFISYINNIGYNELSFNIIRDKLIERRIIE